ncbi:MAG: response regulator [Rhodospirillales bacterium]|nr:response regulator [Rhodospirillales bacterium]
MIDDRSKSYNIQRLNFLLVDDNKFMRSVVRAVLNSWGCKTIAEASDGEEALKELKSFPADIVIADWEMAPMNGIEFARRLRSDPDSPNRFVPVIMLTAHTEAWRVKSAREAGIHEFLVKPVMPKALYERICVLIERPRKFVRAGNYFGPDRHRHKKHHHEGEDRRKDEGGDT